MQYRGDAESNIWYRWRAGWTTVTVVIDDSDDDPPADMGRDFRMPDEEEPMAIDKDEDECDDDDDENCDAY
jgi:hypothetical protein